MYSIMCKVIELHTYTKEGVIMKKDLNFCYLLDTYRAMLTENQVQMMTYYYDDDLSLGEIAENCGITRQGVRDSIKRGEKVLIELEEKLGLCKKLKAIEASVDQIRENAQAIIVENSPPKQNKRIFESLLRIDEALERLAGLLQ